MNRRTLAAAVLLICAGTGVADAQMLNARRIAMGGVLLPGGGPASDAVNVAYRAVPPARHSTTTLPIPLGLIQLFSHPPTFDTSDPDFNVYELANQLYNPPWNLQLVEPSTPSNDIVVSLGRDYLAIQLGDIANLFPEEGSEFGGVMHYPAMGLGFRNAFANLTALTHFENELKLNDPLLGALRRGEPFTTNTEYALNDDAQGQAVAALQFGWAGAVSGRPADAKKTGDRSGFYAGARAKVLRGLTYGDATNHVGFTTSDTLFSSAPIEMDYVGTTRTAMPGDGGWGQGFDAGIVWIKGSFELGVGANDVGSRVKWKVEESVAQRDSATGDVKSTVVARDVPLTSEIPATYSATVARRFGNTLVAADVVHGIFDTTFHLGAEHWIGPLAVRAGSYLDPEHTLQYGGGLGVKVWRLGADAGVATNSRNLSHERGVELSLSLALYNGSEP